MGEFQKEKEFLKRDKSLLKEKMSANVSSKKYALDFSKISRQVFSKNSIISFMERTLKMGFRENILKS